MLEEITGLAFAIVFPLVALTALYKCWIEPTCRKDKE